MTLAWLVLLLLLPAGVLAASESPVAAVVDGRLRLVTEAGQGDLPLHVSADWTHALPEVTRAMVLVHGELRDADGSLRIAEATRCAGCSAL